MIDILEELEVRERIHPISVESYHAMGDMGLVDARVELLNGAIVEKMSKSPLHTFLVEYLTELISLKLLKAFKCRTEQPLTLAESEPEPDLAVVDRVEDNYQASHPGTAHLVIEVAVSSQKSDREKATIYAGAGVPEFWLIDVVEKQVEVYSQPIEGNYQKVSIESGESILSSEIANIEFSITSLFAGLSENE